MYFQGGTFYPALSYISAITLGNLTTVTFTEDHDFTVGEVISFRVSKQYGTVELNNQQATILTIAPTTITVSINSTNYTPFNASPTNPQYLAVVVPSSSGIIPGAIPPQTSLFDAFDDVPVS
jgi:hypothetical protein